MGLLNWLVVLLPVSFIMYMGLYSRRYVRQVSDFLSAGRLCGRYVISVGDIANALAIITLVAYVETHYATGYATAFWSNLSMPIGIAFALTGFCTYRFRQTKAMSFGQFLEMRYSRKFRIFAATLRSLSEMLANMIMPAIAARFFIYFLGLPHEVMIFGFPLKTFIIVVFICLVMAITIICCGGTLALVITDSLQGMLCYPLMALFVGFVLIKFSWSNEIVPVMSEKIGGESFLNPYDISELRDFNVFYIVVTLISAVLNRANWIGAGTSSAARSPHEQKMSTILGTFRGALGVLFYVLIAVILITAFNHRDFKEEAHEYRLHISHRVADELLNDGVRDAVDADLALLQPQEAGKDGNPVLMSRNTNLDTKYLDSARTQIIAGFPDDAAAGQKQYQQFKSLYHQMMTAVGMRHILPEWMVGLFCLLMVMAMVSTDDTRIFSASLTLTQDVVMPLMKRQLTPEEHMKVIRIVSIGVGVFFLFGSCLMNQLDYINMFVTTTVSMWVGAGSMMIFGLYSRFGTTKGAWASLLSGMGVATFYLLLKENWTTVYQFLETHGWVENVDSFLRACSAPFEPWIQWRIVPEKCPINAYENQLLTMIVSFVVYIVVSKCTCKEPFNLDRLLHRGKYNTDGINQEKEKWTFKTVFKKLIGITPEYSLADKFTAWALFGYSIVYSFFGCFVAVLIWNHFDPWPNEWWGTYFLIVQVLVPGVLAVICTFVFGIGGVIDLRRLFRDLKNREVDALDNGMVEGSVSIADQAKFAAIEAESKKAEAEEAQK